MSKIAPISPTMITQKSKNVWKTNKNTNMTNNIAHKTKTVLAGTALALAALVPNISAKAQIPFNDYKKIREMVEANPFPPQFYEKTGLTSAQIDILVKTMETILDEKVAKSWEEEKAKYTNDKTGEFHDEKSRQLFEELCRIHGKFKFHSVLSSSFIFKDNIKRKIEFWMEHNDEKRGIVYESAYSKITIKNFDNGDFDMIVESPNKKQEFYTFNKDGKLKTDNKYGF